MHPAAPFSLYPHPYYPPPVESSDGPSNPAEKKSKGRFCGLLQQDPLLKELKPALREALEHRLRELFEGELESLKLMFDSPKNPSCFIYFNPDEIDITSWTQELLIPDLLRLGVRPVDTYRENEEFAIVICTPSLETSDTINHMKSCIDQKKGTIIPILVKWDDDSNVNAVNPFTDCYTDIFAVRAPLDNYAAILQLFVVLLNSEGRAGTRKIANEAIDRIKNNAREFLKYLLQQQRSGCTEIQNPSLETNRVPMQGKEACEEMIGAAYTLGNKALQGKDALKAKVFFISGIELCTARYGAGHAKTLDFQLRIARCCYELEQIDEAIEACKSVIKEDQSLRAYRNLGNLYAILEQFENAQRMFAIALKHPQANSATRLDYVFLLLNHGMNKDATTHLEMIALSSDDSKLFYGGIDIPALPAWCEKAFVDYYGTLRITVRQLASFLLQKPQPLLKPPFFLQTTELLVESQGGNFCALVQDEQPLAHEFRVVLNFELRAVFESAMKALKVLFKVNAKTPSCFICFNTDEKDIMNWLTHTLIPDLEEIGVTPVCSLTCLDAGDSLEAFEARAGTEDFALVICTPALMRKLSNPQSGVSIEIAHMQQRKKGIIPVLVTCNCDNVDDINPFKDREEVFTVKAPLDNYAEILPLFAILINNAGSLETALEIGNSARNTVIAKGKEILKDLQEKQTALFEDVTDLELRKEAMHNVISALLKDRTANQFDKVFKRRQMKALSKWVTELGEGKTPITRFMIGTIHDLALDEASKGNLEEAQKYLFLAYKFCGIRYGIEHDYSISYMLMYAKCCYDQGKTPEAIEAYREAALHAKSDAYAYKSHFNLGRLYILEDKVELAEEHFLAALKLPQATLTTQVDYACLLIYQERFDEAIRSLQEISALDNKCEITFGKNDIPNPLEETWHLLTGKVLLKHFARSLLVQAYRQSGQNEKAERLSKEPSD